MWLPLYFKVKNMGVLSQVFLESNTITDQPVVIAFEFEDISSVPKGKDPGNSIVIRPATVRTWFRMKPLLMSIDKNDYEQLLIADHESNMPDSELIGIVSKYDDVLMDIVYLGIHNKVGDMPDWFKCVLRENCTWRDIRILFNAIVFRLGVQSFCKSITTVASVSPMTESEIIAAQRNEKSWKVQ